MNSIYRFSPITTKKSLLEAIQYIASKSTELCKKITGKEYPISGLTVFSHYPEEFETLKKFLLELGERESEHNGLYVKLRKPINLPNNKLSLLRVRVPDPYRLHVGCNDFEVPSYDKFKNRYLKQKPDNLRLITRLEYEMIEFFDPDFDILAYVVSQGK